MKSLIFSFLLLMQTLTSVLQAQRHSMTIREIARTFGFTAEEGIWQFEVFAGNIIKTTFQPNGYQPNELVSNAVILKPTRQKITLDKLWDGAVMKLGEKITLARKEGILWFYIDGKLVTVLQEAIYKDGYHGFALRLQPDEKIFGGGQRALPMDRRGQRFNLYNSPSYAYSNGAGDLNFSVPFFLSSHGYGLFFDNPSKGYADIGRANAGMFEAGFVSGELNFYIIPGKNADSILQSYTRLTGRQPMPPRWAFGNFMSRFGYRSEDEVKEVYGKMKEENFPMDAIVFDLFWFGDSIRGTMGNLDWTNQEKWPDPKRMIGELSAEQIKTILITEPFVLNTTHNYLPSRQYHTTDSNGNPYTYNDFYFGQGGLIDIFRQDAQDWFWSKYRLQARKGVAGWWGDLGEPEKHPSNTFHNLQDLGFKRRFGADEVHNLYGHYWSKMLHEKYAKHYPGTRLFHLNRSGFAGSQRYSVFPWTGDVHRNWSGFKAQLPILLGMSLSGIPYIHSDAGGFAMGQKDPELYTRWLQFASFTPVFRPHGTALGDADPNVQHIESEPVFYPEPYKSIVRDLIQLRYDLAPYNYTLAFEQQQWGRPLMRPMFYHYPEDTACYSAVDQYLWGENILVAPVFDQKAIEKTVYLPKGPWYHYAENKLLQGGRWMNVPAGIEDIPFFIRAGAFIPKVMGLKNLEDYSTKELEVMYVPAAHATSYTLFDDDGRTAGSIQNKQYELLQFSGKSTAAQITISVKTNGGNFNGRPAGRNISFVIPALERSPGSVTVNGKAVNTFSFDEEGRILRLKVAFNNQPLKVEIDY